MEDVILSWNATNWITIVLMAAVGFLLIGALTQAYKSWQSSSGSS